MQMFDLAGRRVPRGCEGRASAYHREEFGRIRASCCSGEGSPTVKCIATEIAFSQVGDLCNGVICTRAQIEKLIAGLDLDPVEWMVKAGFVPEGVEADALVLALGALGEVAAISPERAGNARLRQRERRARRGAVRKRHEHHSGCAGAL